MAFMEQLRNVLDNRVTYTENGALAYATTGKALMDLNFAVASLRNESEERIARRFVQAFYEDKMLALKWLFFLRDVRGGLGERRSFRVILQNLIQSDAIDVDKMIELVAEYGRFDDLLCLLDTSAEDRTLAFIKRQLETDMKAMIEKKSVSLCAKWMPSNNTSSEESRQQAKKLQQYLGLTVS